MDHHQLSLDDLSDGVLVGTEIVKLFLTFDFLLYLNLLVVYIDRLDLLGLALDSFNCLLQSELFISLLL